MPQSSQQPLPTKIIPPAAHSFLDYFLVILLFIAPTALPAITGWLAAVLYALAAVHLAMTIMTRFSGGLFAVIPLRIHGLIELLISIGLIISPWIFAFANQPDERNAVVVLGLLLFIIWMFSDYGVRSHTDADDSNQPSDQKTDKDPNRTVAPTHHA